MVRQRVRIRFRKRGDLRFLGHRDLARTLERLFRRAGLALAMSEGFHPKPKMSFPSALAVGVEGLDEVMELELAETTTAAALGARLVGEQMPGLEFVGVEVLADGVKKARLQAARYRVAVPPDRRRQAAEAVAALLAAPACPVARPRGGRALDVRPFIDRLALDEGVLEMRLWASEDGSAGPRDVLRALGLEDLETAGACLSRCGVELQP